MDGFGVLRRLKRKIPFFLHSAIRFFFKLSFLLTSLEDTVSKVRAFWSGWRGLYHEACATPPQRDETLSASVALGNPPPGRPPA